MTQADAPKPSKMVNLALQGGGAHGAFTWGVLDRLLEDGRLDFDGHQRHQRRRHERRQSRRGHAQGRREGAREHLANFWRAASLDGGLAPVQRDVVRRHGEFLERRRRSPPFCSRRRACCRPAEFNPLNINPLRNVLAAQVDFAALRASDQLKLFIAATNVETGKVRVFHRQELTLDMVMASACLPTIFRAVEIDGRALLGRRLHGQSRAVSVLLRNRHDRRRPRPDQSDRAQGHADDGPRNHGPDRRNHLQRVAAAGVSRHRFRRAAEGRGAARRHAITRASALHVIEAQDELNKFGAASKVRSDYDFFVQLRDIGRKAATEIPRRAFRQHRRARDAGRAESPERRCIRLLTRPCENGPAGPPLWRTLDARKNGANTFSLTRAGSRHKSCSQWRPPPDPVMPPNPNFLLSVDPQHPPQGLAGRRRRHRQFRRRASRPPRRHRAGEGSGAEARPALRRADLRAASGRLFRRRRAQSSASPAATPRRIGWRELGLDGMFVLTFDSGSGDAFDAEISCTTSWRGGLAPAPWSSAMISISAPGARARPPILREAGPKLGMTVEIVEKVVADEEGSLDAVSSTATREALQCGDVRDRRRLLGPSLVADRPRHPRRQARTPAGLSHRQSGRRPRPAGSPRHLRCRSRDRWQPAQRVSLKGVASFGRRPTVDNGPPLLEVYIFDLTPRTFMARKSKFSSSPSCEGSRNSTRSRRWSRKSAATKNRRGKLGV